MNAFEMFTGFQPSAGSSSNYEFVENFLPHATFMPPQSDGDSLFHLAQNCLGFLRDSQQMMATIAADINNAQSTNTNSLTAENLANRAELAALAMSRAESAVLHIFQVLRAQQPSMFASTSSPIPLPSPESTTQDSVSTCASPVMPVVCQTTPISSLCPSPVAPQPKPVSPQAMPVYVPCVQFVEDTTSSFPVAEQAPLCDFTTTIPTTIPTTTLTTTTTPTRTSIVTPSKIGIRSAGELESVWYADRQFPDFVLEIFDKQTDLIQTQINGWKVRLTIEDGLGNDVTGSVSRLAPESLGFFIEGGQVTIQGFRFADVSSKYASGVFRMVASVEHSLSNAPCGVIPFVSTNIQVLSYRLFHAPKVPTHRLRPEDNLSKMKGIGSMYAKRLRTLGVFCIRDLALLANDKAACCAIVERIRKERGALTMVKLSEYIAEAQAVVARSEGENTYCNSKLIPTKESSSPSCDAPSSLSSGLSSSPVLLQIASPPPPPISPQCIVLSTPPQPHTLRRKRQLETINPPPQPEMKRICLRDDICPANMSPNRNSGQEFDVVDSFLLETGDWL